MAEEGRSACVAPRASRPAGFKRARRSRGRGLRFFRGSRGVRRAAPHYLDVFATLQFSLRFASRSLGGWRSSTNGPFNDWNENAFVAGR